MGVMLAWKPCKAGKAAGRGRADQGPMGGWCPLLPRVGRRVRPTPPDACAECKMRGASLTAAAKAVKPLVPQRIDACIGPLQVATGGPQAVPTSV